MCRIVGDLSSAKLFGTNLSSADLSSANLLYVILINPEKYDNLIVNEETDFTDAIIDDPKFIGHIMQFTSKVPNKIENKKGLKSKLERKLNPEYIQILLESSKLPD